jgi:predicted nucleic acid-binding protein
VSGAYLDASALVKLTVTELETAALRRFLRRHPQRFTNRVARVEVTRAVRRLPMSREAPVQAAFDGVTVIDLDPSIANRAGVVEPVALRSLDAIHLATALTLGEDLDVFVTYDARQGDAARTLGLTVEAPSA